MIEKYQELKQAGFSDNEIQEYMRPNLDKAGFTEDEINLYFKEQSGERALALTGYETSDFIKSIPVLLSKELPGAKEWAGQTIIPVSSFGPRALSYKEAAELGWQQSNVGMITRLKPADPITQEEYENMGLGKKTVMSAASIGADMPIMAVGAKVGGTLGASVGAAVGSAAPLIGNAAGGAVGGTIGAGAGAFALEATVRSILIQAYEQGEVKSYDELLERIQNVDAGEVGGEAAKAAAIGAITSMAGVIAKAGAKTAGMGKMATGATAFGAEVSALTTTSAAFEGQIPTMQDFLESAVMIAALKGTNASLRMSAQVTKDVLPKLKNAFVQKGDHPKSILFKAKDDIVSLQNLFSKNLEVDGKSIKSEKKQIKSAYKTVKKNPIEGNPIDEIAHIRPKDLGEFIINRGAAIKDAQGNTIVYGSELFRQTGTRSNFGMTKLIFKHEISDKDAMRLPQIIRNYEPAEIYENYRIWRLPDKKKGNLVVVFKNEKPQIGFKVKELNEVPYPAVRGTQMHVPKDGYQDVRFPFSGRSAEHTLGNSNPDLRVLSPNKSDTQPVITISTSEGTSNQIIQNVPEKVKPQYLVSMYYETRAPNNLPMSAKRTPVSSFENIQEANAVSTLKIDKPIEKAVLPSGTISSEKTIPLSQTITLLSDKLNVPIRVGNIRAPKTVQGLYKTNGEVIRTRLANDIRVISHEVGHHIEKIVFDGKGQDVFKKYKAELKPIASKGNALSEGFAEFMARYIINPTDAKKVAPQFYDFFEKTMDAKAPEIKSVLQQAQKNVKVWSEQPYAVEVLSHVSVGKKGLPRLNISGSEAFEKVYTAVVDDLYPIKSIQKKLGVKELTGNDAYSLARLQKDWVGKAEHFLRKAPFSAKTYQNDGLPLQEILRNVDNIDAFRSYIVAKRAVELHARGIETGIDPKAAEMTVKTLQGTYQNSAKQLYEYQDKVLKYGLSSGLFSQKTYDKMKSQNQFYVPFKRVMDLEKATGLGGRSLTARNPVKKIKGSGRDIIDPLESIIADTYSIINAAEKNKVGLAVADLAKQDKSGKFIEKIPVPMQATKVEMPELIKELGIEDITSFKTSNYIDKKNQIMVYRNGLKEVYQVDPTLAKVMNGLDPASVNWVGRVFMAPKKWLQAGATLTPDFIGKNIFRDSIQAFITSENGFTPGMSSVKGLMHAAQKDNLYWEWRKSGGGNSAMVSMDRIKIQKNLADLTQTGYTKRVWNTIKNPMEALRVASEVSENMTRLGEFEAALKGKSRTPENMRKAAFASRELTLDFARSGYLTRALNAYVAFMNAGVQGTDKFVRNFITKPGKTMLSSISAVIVPSVLIALATHDDEVVQEVPQVQRDMNWVFRVGDTVWRLPKPQQYGYLGTVAERSVHFALDKLDKKDVSEAYYNVGKAFLNEFQINTMPTALIPAFEEWGNRSFFNDRPIIPYDREKVLPEYQYTPYTTETAKFISSKFGNVVGKENTFSPAILENYIRGWTGGTGRYLLEALDFSMRKMGIVPDPVKPKDTLADVPFVRAFTLRQPSAGSESIQRFYDDYDEVETYLNSFRSLKKEMNIQGMQELSIYKAYSAVEPLKGMLAEQSKMIRMISADPSMSPDEKRQLIDNIYLGMIEIAKKGRRNLKMIKEKLKEVNQ